MLALAALFGIVVGVSLGLTGGGGSIVAVPLLVYGLSVAPRQAVGVSLAAVGATALAGAVHRLWRREVEVRTGLLFAAAGMLGAPVGTAVGRRVPEALLLLLFAALMLWVAARMWRKASRRPEEASVVRAPVQRSSRVEAGPACRRDPAGSLRMTSRCGVVLASAGVGTGVLSGLFGVGGGFVVVPALVLVSGMDIHRAVATSLLVIALVSASGLASLLVAGEPLSGPLVLAFAGGGVGGLALGTVLGRTLSPVALQKGFAVVIVVVAAFVVVKTVA